MALPTHAGFNHGGHDFYVAFLPYPLGKADAADEVKLYITTPETIPVTFTISIPGMGYFNRTTVDPGEVREFTFNGRDYALRNTTDRSKGIIIKTENERQIFVYGAQDMDRATDSLLVLPPHDLGVTSYTYIAAMIHTVDSGTLSGTKVDIYALVGIVSGEDDTFLTITSPQNVTIGTESVKAGERVLVTLARAETLLIAFIGDLTGTKVTSNRPISFFSGDQCTYVPNGLGACDQIVYRAASPSGSLGETVCYCSTEDTNVFRRLSLFGFREHHHCEHQLCIEQWYPRVC